MEVEIKRFEYGSTFTIGELFIDGTKQCYTLEDVTRDVGVKVKTLTSIPAGKYSLVIDWSNKYQKKMLHILDVPMFEGIRIHTGNSSKDTEGCIILGTSWPGGDWVSGSKSAYNKVYPKVEETLAKGDKVSITVVDTK